MSDAEKSELKRETVPARIAGTCMGIVRGWPPTYCTRTGTVNRSGKLFCRQHDPGDPEENRRRRIERWNRDEARLEAEARRRELVRISEVGGLTDQDLRKIIAGGGIWAFLPWGPGETDERLNEDRTR